MRIGNRPLTCDAKGCREPAAAHATYWVPEHPWFHLCRGHWGMIGDRREELRRLLGIEPEAPEAP